MVTLSLALDPRFSVSKSSALSLKYFWENDVGVNMQEIHNEHFLTNTQVSKHKHRLSEVFFLAAALPDYLSSHISPCSSVLVT